MWIRSYKFIFSASVLKDHLSCDSTPFHGPFMPVLPCLYPCSKWPNSKIPECICTISHNALFRTEMCTFLFWMEHCGIWNRFLGFVKLVYFDGGLMNSLAPGRCGCNFNMCTPNTCCGLSSRELHVKLLPGEYLRTHLMISQHRPGHGLVPSCIKPLLGSKFSLDPDLHYHMALLCHNESPPLKMAIEEWKHRIVLYGCNFLLPTNY